MEIEMKNTVLTLQKQKEEHDKIVMVTAYDYTTAKIMDEAGVKYHTCGRFLRNGNAWI